MNLKTVLPVMALTISAMAHAAPPVANFTATVSPASAKPGQIVTVKIMAKVDAPWHIYSVKPVPPPGPQATKFTFDAPGLALVGGIMESKPKTMRDVSFEKDVSLHEKTATFTQKFTVAKSAKSGKMPIKIEAFFMACDEKRCLPPRFVTITPPMLNVGAK